MSSTERAPEPTMEDILASIRRIITDDDAGQATAEKPDQKAQAEDESLEGEADKEIIDDIARVLGGSGEAPANQDEEILDLTAEFGGLEIVEDEVQEVQESFEVVEVAELAEVLELEDVESIAAGPEPAAEPIEPSAPPAAYIPAQDASLQDMAPAPEMVQSEVPVPPQMQEPVAAAPETTLSASEEAASALERVIAALKAGQVPSSSETPAEPFQFQSAPQSEQMASPDAMPQEEPEAIPPETIPMAVPMSEGAPEDETHPDPEGQLVPEAEANLEVELESASPLEPLEDDTGFRAELVLTEAGTEEMVVESEPEKPTFWPAEASQESSLQEPSFNPEPEPEPVAEAAPEPVATAINGSGTHEDEGVSRTLEDSIKDMLRPMLRQWLDENMPRMIREELDADALRRHQDWTDQKLTAQKPVA